MWVFLYVLFFRFLLTGFALDVGRGMATCNLVEEDLQIENFKLLGNRFWLVRIALRNVFFSGMISFRWHVCRVNFARKIFFEPRIFLRKMLRNFPRNFWAFVSVGQKKSPENSLQISHKNFQISLRKIKKNSPTSFCRSAGRRFRIREKLGYANLCLDSISNDFGGNGCARGPPKLVREGTHRREVEQKNCIPRSSWILCKLTGPLYSSCFCRPHTSENDLGILYNYMGLTEAKWTLNLICIYFVCNGGTYFPFWVKGPPQPPIPCFFRIPPFFLC